MDRSSSWYVVFVLAALGCQPDIGDPCNVPSDCALSGNRICDTTQPGGYCTQFNCEPGSCPEEAICVAFNGSASSAPACRDPQDTPRLQRTFCLRKCNRDSDCRSQYACVDVTDVPEWSASIVERKSRSKVCVVPYSGGEPEGSTDVCAPGPLPDGSFPAPLEPGAGGAGGAGGLDADVPDADEVDAARDAASDARPPDAALDAAPPDACTDAGVSDAAPPSDAATDAVADVVDTG